MDGFEVCRRLKADAATHDIPVIFVTGNNDKWSEAEGLQLGAVDFITKPINPPVAMARVVTHLNLAQARDQHRGGTAAQIPGNPVDPGVPGVENRGAIFLSNPGERTLRLASHINLPQPLPDACNVIPFGHCLCGLGRQGGDFHATFGLDPLQVGEEGAVFIQGEEVRLLRSDPPRQDLEQLPGLQNERLETCDDRMNGPPPGGVGAEIGG